MVLAECEAERQTAINALIPLLSDDGYYIVDGDFYGNGGEGRVVGDRAVDALVALRASTELSALLADAPVNVRVRAIRALGKLGEQAVADQLIRGAEDPDYLIRRETMSALGQLGRNHPECKKRLRTTLEDAAHNDHRLSVRDEAERALRSWQ